MIKINLSDFGQVGHKIILRKVRMTRVEKLEPVERCHTDDSFTKDFFPGVVFQRGSSPKVSLVLQCIHTVSPSHLAADQEYKN